MELRDRIDDRPGVCERDVRDIFRASTSGGQEDQREQTRKNNSYHYSVRCGIWRSMHTRKAPSWAANPTHGHPRHEVASTRCHPPLCRRQTPATILERRRGISNPFAACGPLMAIAQCSNSYNKASLRGLMPFSIRPHRRFPMQCLVAYCKRPVAGEGAHRVALLSRNAAFSFAWAKVGTGGDGQWRLMGTQRPRAARRATSPQTSIRSRGRSGWPYGDVVTA